MNTVATISGFSWLEKNVLTGATTSSGRSPTLGGVGKIASMTDVVTPRFTTLRRRGHIVNNDMSRESFEVDMPPGNYYLRYKDVNGSGVVTEDRLFQHLPAFYINQSAWSTPLKLCHNMTDSQRSSIRSAIPVPGVLSSEQVLINALAKANSTDVLALVTLAEARKTVESMYQATRAFSRIRSYIARSGKRLFTPSGAIRMVGDGLRVWLEVRYGILPTYYDMLGYSEYVNTIGKRARVRFVSRSIGSGTASPYIETYSDSYHIDEMRAYRSRYIDRTAGALVEPYAAETSAIQSLGIDRIGSTSWELIPFSFVVDWFFNTSSLIAAHEGRFGQRVLANWTVERQSVLSTITRSVTNKTTLQQGGGSKQGHSSVSAQGTEVWKTVIRKADTKVGVLPSFQVRLNWKKVIDLIALTGGIRKDLNRLRL